MHKYLLSAIAFAFSVEMAFAAAGINGVVARQRYPWNGKVDISYNIAGDIAAAAAASDCFPVLQVTATDKTTGKKYVATRLSGDMGLTEGVHTLVWDLEAEKYGLASDRVVFTVAVIANPTYCVIDISPGPTASVYPVQYLLEEPEGGFNTAEYKSSKIVLKLIEAGSFIMGSEKGNEDHRTTITKPFYMAIFAGTQKQYYNMTALTVGQFPGNDLYAADGISYNALRGVTKGASWPSSDDVEADSLIGKLRQRTGLRVDIPTEAQWEYACRAGTETNFSYGDEPNAEYMWYGEMAGYTTLTVGTKLPNPWGLYDMHGNVMEWCLDWYAVNLQYGVDPKGPSTGEKRIIRGGSWYRTADYEYSSARSYTLAPSVGHNETGFRLVINVPE